MTGPRDPAEPRESQRRSPLATPEQLLGEPVPFPSTTAARPHESWFPDWRLRLTRNLARRSDGRWEPLTHVHRTERPDDPIE